MAEAHTIYLALGSNLGDRAGYIQAALGAASTYLEITALSRLYETLPMYVVDQPQYYNAVCRATTYLAPHDLLLALEETMRALGRVRTIRYGPRVIDLDILFYNNLVLETPDLTIPHPRLTERRFVLEPLCDIAPDLPHPVSGATMQMLLAQLPDPPLVPIMSLQHLLSRTATA